VTQVRPSKHGARLGPIAVAGALLVAIGLSTFLTVRDRQRWNAYVDRLQNERGIVVVDSGRRGGRYFVTGLRDPVAQHPDAMLARAGIAPDRVERRWELYQAGDPEFVLARAREVLRPPRGVSLALRDQILLAAGTAPARWIHEIGRLARVIPGIRGFDDSQVRADDLEVLARNVESLAIHFPKGGAGVFDAAERTRAVAALRQLNDLARWLDEPLPVTIVGHADTDGPEASNVRLSAARAESVQSSVPADELYALRLAASGVGSAEPLARGGTEADKYRNRRVSFKVNLPRPREAGARQP
jgi:OOP family OmpA-OmpF porin